MDEHTSTKPVNKQIRMGWLNRLLLGVDVVAIRKDGVCFGNGCMEYPKPLDALAYVRGWLFDQLVWGQRKFRFLRCSDLRIAMQSIDAECRSYWQPLYKETFDTLVDVSEKFEQYVMDYPRYIRVSHKEDWLQRLQKVREFLGLQDEYRELGFDLEAIRPLFLQFIANPDGFVAERNRAFLQQQRDKATDLFESLEDNPLTDRQCDACVYDEDNVLLIAGAGTGKTSTMYAKAAYLVEQGFARPEEILMLAFGKDARKELEERVYQRSDLHGTVIRTFHALGKEIIGAYENRATDVSVLATDDKQYVKFIDQQIERLFQEPAFDKIIQALFGQYFYPQPNDLDFKSHGEYLKYVKDNEIRDLAGNYVKSFEEFTVSNFLFKSGIRFEYEPQYPHPVSQPGRGVYRPDYYLPDLDVYIEHFGINEKGETRPGIDKDKYNADRQWKLEVHEQYGTNLIQTFSYQSKQGLGQALETELKSYCEERELDFDDITNPVTSKALFQTLKELGVYKKFSQLLASFISLFKSSPYNLDQIQNSKGDGYEVMRHTLFISVFSSVYQKYTDVLDANGTMDFADMIRDATNIVKRDDFHQRTHGRFRFKYIMVDEFQDISPIRAELVHSLRDAGKQCALFCVGDDWQAIYRFTGSDVELTTNFENYFGATHISYLDKTFRFNDKIEAVASGFVQQNPNQLQKDLITHTTSDRTEVCVRYGEKDEICFGLLEEITAKEKKNVSVLILSRFTKAIEPYRNIGQKFPGLNVKAMTAHSSKGKQADYVILLDVIDGAYGFPSKVVTDPILEYLLPKLEDFAYAEERRLFYVALTRAKKTVYIHSQLGLESEFLKELRVKRFDVQFGRNELSQFVVDAAKCPECGTGELIPRLGQYGLFYVCGLGQRYCDTRVSACPKCGQAPLLRNETHHYCASPDCDYKAMICPECGTGRMVERTNGNTGNLFWGCTNYRKDDENSCNKTVPIKRRKKVM